jgi:hypothetical protein
MCDRIADAFPNRQSPVRDMPMLAASYASERGLTLMALVPDFRRFPADAEDRRDGILVAEADAAVVVWDDRDPPDYFARGGGASSG